MPCPALPGDASLSLSLIRNQHLAVYNDSLPVGEDDQGKDREFWLGRVPAPVEARRASMGVEP
jgi:hypothetical protein